jgi:hypothetical protein
VQKFMISAAAITVFTALLASAPARAELNFGPVQSGTQCWHVSPNSSNSKDFGYWGTCPQSASAPAAVHHKKRVQREH